MTLNHYNYFNAASKLSPKYDLLMIGEIRFRLL